MVAQLLSACGVKVVEVRELNRREVIVVSDASGGEPWPVIWQCRSEDHVNADEALRYVMKHFGEPD